MVNRTIREQMRRNACERLDWRGGLPGLTAALKERLESLSILFDNVGAKPSGAFSHWRGPGRTRRRDRGLTLRKNRMLRDS